MQIGSADQLSAATVELARGFRELNPARSVSARVAATPLSKDRCEPRRWLGIVLCGSTDAPQFLAVRGCAWCYTGGRTAAAEEPSRSDASAPASAQVRC